MKVYLTPPQPSRGLERIATALRRYAPPWVQVSTFPRNVDLTVIYAIGRRDAVQRQCEEILSRGKKYAIVQCCLRSTMSPFTWDWITIWQSAEVVWSYYDLRRLHEEDGAGCGYWETQEQMDRYDDDRDGAFYHTPLGADASVFYPRDMPKQYVVGTSGLSRLSESVRECALAAEQVNRVMFHLGSSMPYDNVVSATDIDDLQLATRWSMCEFVSGLRRKEGFELPAIEGLLCGARPILFNSKDYRRWYEPWGEFIEEGTRQEVIDQLVELFKKGARPVTTEEREAAVERFNWKTIVGGFYERLRR